MPADVFALKEFFHDLLVHGDQRYFHPHGLDDRAANAVCNEAGPDYFCAGFFSKDLVAYGMLRGWKEGFEIPTLGLAIHPNHRKQGWGKRMLKHLHQVAIERNCQKIRLTVYRANTQAIDLFLKAGYYFEPGEGDRAVAWLDLRLDASSSHQ